MNDVMPTDLRAGRKAGSGYRVLFTTAVGIVNHLALAHRTGRLDAEMKRYLLRELPHEGPVRHLILHRVLFRTDLPIPAFSSRRSSSPAPHFSNVIVSS
jgi:hypothetical protein